MLASENATFTNHQYQKLFYISLLSCILYYGDTAMAIEYFRKAYFSIKTYLRNYRENISVLPVLPPFIYLKLAVPNLETFIHCWWTKTTEENDVYYLLPLELQISLNLQRWMSTILA